MNRIGNQAATWLCDYVHPVILSKQTHHYAECRMRFVLPLLLLAASPSFAAERPHVIIVLADDLGWGDLACYAGVTPTPHLDRMAREGVRFEQAYVAAPICSPSRCGIVTGQFPARWRITS